MRPLGQAGKTKPNVTVGKGSLCSEMDADHVVTGAADSCLKEKNIFDIMILIEELYDSCAPHLKITEGKVL